MATKKPSKLEELTASLTARKPTPPGPAAPEAPAPIEKLPSEAVAKPERTDALIPNQSVSLYESDLVLLERVRHWLTERGLPRCNASEAMRLCVRLATAEKNADALAELCRLARSKDGRRTRSARQQ